MGARGGRLLAWLLAGSLLGWGLLVVESATGQAGRGGLLSRALPWIFASGTDIRPLPQVSTVTIPSSVNRTQWVLQEGVDYERGITRWSGGEFQFGTQSAGAGVARDVVVLGHGSAAFRVTATRHLESEGTAPAVRGPCGTAASVAGTDAAGKLTLGTGTPGPFCELHFVNAWQNPPACVAVNETTTNVVRTTTTTGAVTFRGTLAAEDVLAYVCVGRR